MRKISLINLSLAVVALGSIATVSFIMKNEVKDTVVSADASTSFNITTENTMGVSTIKLNVDQTLTAKTDPTSIDWYVNGVKYTSWVQPFTAGDTFMSLSWGDAGNAGQNSLTHYVHYYIPSGTDFGGGYTLGSDYNFWWSHQSAGNSNLAWTFQNGGNDAAWKHAIPSIHISGWDSGGAQDSFSRFMATFTITKEAGVYSAGSWNAANIMMAEGSGDYALKDQAGGGTDTIYGLDSSMAAASKDLTSGTWSLLLYYAGLGVTAGDNVARSFYIPKGTLYGGFNENYGFYIDSDVYFDWTGSAFLGNFTTSMKDRVYTPIDALVTNLHMDADVSGQCTGYWAAAKASYAALSDEAKGIFASQSAYTAAKARYNAWAVANSDTGTGMFAGTLDTNSSSIVAISALAIAVALASIVLVVTLRKKKHS